MRTRRPGARMSLFRIKELDGVLECGERTHDRMVEVRRNGLAAGYPVIEIEIVMRHQQPFEPFDAAS